MLGYGFVEFHEAAWIHRYIHKSTYKKLSKTVKLIRPHWQTSIYRMTLNYSTLQYATVLHYNTSTVLYHITELLRYQHNVLLSTVASCCILYTGSTS